MVHYPRNIGLGRVGALNPTCVLWCAQGYHENVVARGICNWEFSLLYVKCVPRRHQDGHLQSLPGDRGLPQEWYSSLRQACPHMCQGTLNWAPAPVRCPCASKDQMPRVHSPICLHRKSRGRRSPVGSKCTFLAALWVCCIEMPCWTSVQWNPDNKAFKGPRESAI